MTWMERLKRVFDIDFEICPRRGGKLRVIACIEDPDGIATISCRWPRTDGIGWCCVGEAMMLHPATADQMQAIRNRLPTDRKSIRTDSILNVLSRFVDGIIDLVASRFTAGFDIFNCLVNFFACSFQWPLFFTRQEEHRYRYQH
jgi:hypothetical protein